MERFISTRLCQPLANTWGPWISGGLALSAVVAFCPAAWANTLNSWQFDPATQQLTLTLPAGVVPQSSVAEGGDRILITLPQTQIGTASTEARYDGPVRRIQLSQVGDAVQMVLHLEVSLAPGTEPVQIIAMAAGDQTRWVLVPQVAQAAALSPAPTAEGMIVELPPLPADPNLSWPYTGVGRLSISAANLMLPSNLDTFNTLPETLAIDPFNLGLSSGAQVSVPSLEELDAAVGGAITSPTVVVPSLGSPSDPTVATEPLPVVTAPAAPPSTGVIAEPPPETSQPRESVAVAPSAPASSTEASGNPGSIDQDSGGLAIPVIPSEDDLAESAPAQPSPAASPAASTPISEPPPSPQVLPPTAESPVQSVPVQPSPAQPSPVQPSPEPSAPAQRPTQPAGVITQEPGSLQPPVASAPASAPSSAPTSPPFLATEPPSSAPPSAANPVLAVPAQATPSSPGAVVPPTLASEPMVATDSPIAFGQPLPNGMVPSSAPGGDRPLSPDILIASGTVLELRYTGSAPLTLNPNATLNEVLVLETEIRDPATNGVVAPAGSQLIGQFHTHNDSHQWVSQMLIAPNGHRVSFVSTSDYIYGTPQISGGGLALGAGIGALALTLLTGFGGLGLLGGALIGTTAAVGTAPQYIVIQPNDVIYAEVIQDIPRSMPIATSPTEVRDWGTMPGAW